MPASSIHMSICKKLNKKLKKNELEFLIGNIAPDCWRHSKFHSDKLKSHFSSDTVIDNVPTKIENYDNFITKYKNDLDDSFTLGYLIHLMTDNYWKRNVTCRYQKLIDGEIAIKTLNNKYVIGSNNAIKKYLHINNEIASINIVKHYDIQPIILDKYIECHIDEIDLSGLDKTIEHINKTYFKKIDEESTMYDMNDLYEDIESCCNFILKELDNNNII